MFDPIAYINTPRWQKMSLGLERTRELLDGLGRPQDKLRFVHVAGTNGKGSTCALIASALCQAGLRVGLFTSPALYSFEERIRVDATPISLADLRSVTELVRDVAEEMEEHPTEFELLTAVAFSYFAQSCCDIVVVEVGLGGRLDSTNVIEVPEISIITSISFDHRAMLGETLEAIAAEKAGIIKLGTPVVSAPQDPIVLSVIEERVRKSDTSLVVVDPTSIKGSNACFSYEGHVDLELGLPGSFQLINAACALVAIDTLREQGWDVPEAAIREGFAKIQWPGRFELVSKDPAIIFDGAHNIAGMEAFIEALEESYADSYRIVLTGVLADKDHGDMAHLLVHAADKIITVTPHNDRALCAAEYADDLQQAASSSDAQVTTIEAASSIEEGVRLALQEYVSALKDSQGRSPLICVCGSLYLLRSVMEVLRQAGIAL